MGFVRFYMFCHFLLHYFFVALACWAVEYTTKFEYLDQSESFKSQLEEISYLKSFQDKPTQTLDELKWRAERDRVQLENFLHTKGYMASDVSVTVPEMDEQNPKPITVIVKVLASSQYKYADIVIQPEDEVPSWWHINFAKTLNVQQGLYVDYEDIQSAQDKLERSAKNRGRSWASCKKPLLDLNKEKKDAQLIFPIKFGSEARFGLTRIEGLENVPESFVRNRLLWVRGNIFDQRLVDQTKEKLIDTLLFGEVDIHLTPSETDPSVVNIRVSLKESPARSIGVGLRYATSEGIGGRVFWKHKNAFGKAYTMGVSARRTKFETRTEAEWTVPDFLAPHQELHQLIFNSIERKRAYRGRIYGGEFMVGRPLWSPQWSGELGVLLDRARVRQDQTYYNTRLIGSAAALRFDGSNDFLDPVSGLRFSGWGAPYWGTVNHQPRSFVTTRFNVSGYIPFRREKNVYPPLVLAGFARLGKIMGKGVSDIPPHQRFYSGGADSIRAYGPQLIGPLDKNNTPLGGMFLSEYGAELRARPSEKVGFALFAEAGVLTSHGLSGTLDHFKEKALWGVGGGVRYFTPLGPLRFDVAFPMKRRRNEHGKVIDAPYQFYISFGQAF